DVCSSDLDPQHTLIDKMHCFEKGLLLGRGTCERIFATEYRDIDSFHGLLLRRAGQTHQYSIDALLSCQRSRAQALGFVLAELEALLNRIVISSIARDLFTQTRFGGFGLVSKLIDLRRMFARSLHGLLLRCLLARELIAQRIALLFEGGDTSLQRRAFGLRLPHNLYRLPDTGR